MNTDIEASAVSTDGLIRVTVGLGGALRGLDIREEALRQGGRRLGATVVELVGQAAVQAAQRARHQLHDDLTGLPAEALAALGFTDDPELIEQAEETTPPSWRDF